MSFVAVLDDEHISVSPRNIDLLVAGSETVGAAFAEVSAVVVIAVEDSPDFCSLRRRDPGNQMDCMGSAGIGAVEVDIGVPDNIVLPALDSIEIVCFLVARIVVALVTLLAVLTHLLPCIEVESVVFSAFCLAFYCMLAAESHYF